MRARAARLEGDLPHLTAGGSLVPEDKVCPAATQFNSLTNGYVGLVTDYGSSMTQWMSTRQPKYKGSHRLDMERPSASYVVDVRFQKRTRTCPGTDRCS